MTREDLLAGNCKIAEELGKNIKQYCPDVKHVVIIFNPADLTGLVTLLYSGLKPGQVTTLAALDSTRLQSALAKKFGVMQNEVKGCATYGGHGEQMAVFGSAVEIAGRKLSDLIGTAEFPRGRMGTNAQGRDARWRCHHQAPWPQLVPKPLLPLG